MEKVIMNVARTETGYCCDCELLPGWVVTGKEDFEELKKYVQESIDFYLDCVRQYGDEYPEVFDGDYKIIYKFDVLSLLRILQGNILFSALQPLQVSTRNNSAIMLLASVSQDQSRLRRLPRGYTVWQKAY